MTMTKHTDQLPTRSRTRSGLPVLSETTTADALAAVTVGVATRPLQLYGLSQPGGRSPRQPRASPATGTGLPRHPL
jgi:hypothetical protein